MTGASVVGLHMGALHPFETVLTLVLAFGPFVALGIVIAVRRRHETDAEADADADDPVDQRPR